MTLGRKLFLVGAIAFAAAIFVPQPAGAEVAPKRGGVLEFASTVEPGNYDCHGNTSFAFLHPVAPHYSTLLKFDTGNYPQIVGDLAQSWEVSPDRQTYTFKLRPNVLFHDGLRLTSADIKASYQRIVHPPKGVTSSRQVDFGAIGAIETPDPLTVIFHLQWPDAAILANFASPWNCIYSAAKLAEDPQFPKTHILGSGPFVFLEHKKGESWTGRRWEKYFQPGKPYLDGYQVDFMPGPAIMKAYEGGRIMAEFRGVTPTQAGRARREIGRPHRDKREPVAVQPARRVQHEQEAVRRCARAARVVVGARPVGRGRAAPGLNLSQICRRTDAARREPGLVGSRTREPAWLLARRRRSAR